MKLTIEIKMDNAAFQDDSSRDGERNDEGACGLEVAYILRSIAENAARFGVSLDYRQSVFDSNGNKVGKVEVSA